MQMLFEAVVKVSHALKPAFKGDFRYAGIRVIQKRNRRFQAVQIHKAREGHIKYTLEAP